MGSPMLVLGSLIFGCFGFAVTSWGVRAIRNQQGVPDVGRRFVQIWICLTLLSGLSMMLAAVVMWSRWDIALALGLWPAVLLLAFRLTGIVKVESKLSLYEPDGADDAN